MQTRVEPRDYFPDASVDPTERALGTTQPIVEIGRTRVSGSAGHDNGRWSMAVPRFPTAGDEPVAAIRSLDRPWQRPSTMQRTDFQSPIERQETLEFDGRSDRRGGRERIGDAVRHEPI